jgi:hypothetical protein
MIGPYAESNMAKLNVQIATLKDRCDELNEACSMKQVLIDNTASDLRDMRDLYEREKDELRAEVERLRAALRGTKTMTSQFGGPCWCLTGAMIYCVGQPQCNAATAALSAQPAATGEG